MIEKIILAAGCFWSVQYKLSQLNGVVNTLAVYAGGETANPTYEQVCSDETGHAEAVLVEYNTDILSTGELLRYFFQIHDASQKDRQGPDIGTQYRSAIFYFTDEQKREAELVINEMKNDKYYKGLTIQTLILEATTFYKAEEYHQNYYIKKGY
ncbi:MAG TPA: peptide-methionine (S)-S-oxide reductase MsrA [Bacteroidales bacterium]|nr:peptide-methionine (S)-S-oxide reductase MsrA [Bacteroidales bacterium]